MKYRLFFVGLLMLAIAGQAAVAEEAISHYNVVFSDKEIRTVKIEAEYYGANNKLGMPPWGHPYLEKGWSTFVHGLKVTARNGEEIKVVQEDGGDWRVPHGSPRPLLLNYTVKLNHDEYDWNPAGGIDARPRVLENALFIISKALFIGDENMGQATVEIAVPQEWKVATPWKKIGANRFHARDYYELCDNMIAVGDYILDETTDGPFHMSLAIDRRLEEHKQAYISVLKSVVPEFKKVFNGLPEVDYLITVSAAPVSDGESFNASFHQVINKNDIDGGLIIWGNTMAHELFHFWNGAGLLRPKVHQNLTFFNEGFTEYYTNVCLTRAGLISREQFYAKLAKHFSRYFITSRMMPQPVPSLMKAGENKGANWMRIYGGGATFAFYLDMHIREKTDNIKSLDDVMKLLNDRFGGKEPITVQNVIDAAGAIAGESCNSLFEKYVMGTDEYLPYVTAAKVIGLRVLSFADEVYVNENPEMTLKQKEYLKSYLK